MSLPYSNRAGARHRYPAFDRSRLTLRPLREREHGLSVEAILPLAPRAHEDPRLRVVAHRIAVARERGAAVVLMMGAHVLRRGVQRYLIDLLKRGLIHCIATNGAAAIHDFEFATVGQTTESVARYIRDGRFGLWQETGRLNDIVRAGAERGLGLGESVGEAIEDDRLPHRGTSVFAAAHRLGIPLTVHVGIGYDIVHQHPNCDGAAYGATSYTDFLRFTAALEDLQGGVVMNFGSAVMAPEVFLKGLAMVRNAAAAEGGSIDRFTTLVCDLADLPGDVADEPPRTEPHYYFRPWKTMLARTVAGGGEGLYVKGDHRNTIPGLWTALGEEEQG